MRTLSITETLDTKITQYHLFNYIMNTPFEVHFVLRREGKPRVVFGPPNEPVPLRFL